MEIAPIKSTTTPSLTTLECWDAPATGFPFLSKTVIIMLAVPKSTPTKNLLLSKSVLGLVIVFSNSFIYLLTLSRFITPPLIFLKKYYLNI